jgi:isopenicillin N synthase-like dioxygenase
MPALIDTKPKVQPWTAHPETAADLEWAPLVIIDLGKFDAPGGKALLAQELKDAVKSWGFWTVVGTGIPQEDLDRQLSIGNGFFNLPLEEKRKVPCDFTVGKYVILLLIEVILALILNVILQSYFGYREPVRFIGDTDVKENMEMVLTDLRYSRVSLTFLSAKCCKIYV